MDIIGLNGRMGTGKDTVGAYLVERYGFTRVAFADLLKQSAAALFDVPVSVWEGTKNDPEAEIRFDFGGHTAPDGSCGISLTAREFLQRYGTEAHRDVFGPTFWTDALLRDLPSAGSYVATDARFNEELRAIRRYGGINVQIQRDTEGEDSHSSEADPDWMLIDAIIDNNEDFESLYRSVDAVVEQVFAGSR